MILYGWCQQIRCGRRLEISRRRRRYIRSPFPCKRSAPPGWRAQRCQPTTRFHERSDGKATTLMNHSQACAHCSAVTASSSRIHPAALPRPFSKGLHAWGISHIEPITFTVMFVPCQLSADSCKQIISNPWRSILCAASSPRPQASALPLISSTH